MFEGFGLLINQLLGQIINIPLINPLSFLYVILNLLAMIIGTVLGGGETVGTTPLF